MSSVNSYGQIPTPTKPSNKPQNQTTGSQEQAKVISDAAQSPMTTALLLLAPVTQNRPTDQPQHHENKAPSGWWLIIFNGLLVIIVFLQWWWMRRQVKWMRKSAEIAKDALTDNLRAIEASERAAEAAETAAKAAKDSADALPAMERAYIFVNVRRKEEQKEFVVGKNFCAIVVLNEGKTPAILKRVNKLAKVFVYPYTIPEYPCVPYPKMPVVEDIIARRDLRWIDVDFILTQEELNHINSGSGVLICLGCIQYEDVLGKLHETGFCWWYELTTNEFYFLDDPNNYRT